jgi:hypothetical protein
MQEDDWFSFWLDIIGLTRQCFDFNNNKWEFLPFDGGLFEQADKNPYLWSAINYIIQKEQERRLTRNAESTNTDISH